MKVTLYFEVSKDAEMGTTENGEPCSVYMKIELGDYKDNWRKKLIEKLGENSVSQLGSELSKIDMKYLREINKEEYEDGGGNECEYCC